MKKHAFLIMAHNEFTMLKKLLTELDDERNDLYLHIDKKTKYVDFEEISSWVRRSKLIFVPRRKIYWGTYSIVDCELRMLKTASQNEYAYYHLISGVDLPLKSQEELHSVFDNENSEFVEYHRNGEYGDYFEEKIKYKYPLLKYVGKGGYPEHGIKNHILRKLNHYQTKHVEWQKKHHKDRTKRFRDIVLYKGNQWFSITDELAKYLISKEKQIKKMFRQTNGPDEFIVPTIALNSSFKERIRNYSFRHIDWTRGNPYEFKNSDYEEIIKCGAFFARKVSYNKEPFLVERVLQSIHPEIEQDRTEFPLISIVVPCYNVKDYLSECVESLLAQTYPKTEIILVDDGSTDGTEKMVDGYSNKYVNVKSVHKENGGLSSARNKGIEKAKGEYIAFVDSDDYVNPEYTEKLYKAMINYNSDVAVCGYELFENEHGTVAFSEERAVSGYEALKILSSIYHPENVLYTIAWNKLYRADIFKSIQFTEGRIHEDVFASHRFLGGVDSIAVIKEPLYYYRIRNGSITSPEKKQDIRHLDLIEGLFDRLLYSKNMYYQELTKFMVQANIHGMFELMIAYNDETVRKNKLIRFFRKRAFKLLIGNFWNMYNTCRKDLFKICIYPRKMRKFLIDNRNREILEKEKQNQG